LYLYSHIILNFFATDLDFTALEAVNNDNENTKNW